MLSTTRRGSSGDPSCDIVAIGVSTAGAGAIVRVVPVARRLLPPCCSRVSSCYLCTSRYLCRAVVDSSMMSPASKSACESCILHCTISYRFGRRISRSTCRVSWASGFCGISSSCLRSTAVNPAESWIGISKTGRILHASKKKIPGSGNVGTILLRSQCRKTIVLASSVDLGPNQRKGRESPSAAYAHNIRLSVF